MWFKKKSVLRSEGHYDTEKSADGTTDTRTTDKYYNNNNSSIKSGLPSVDDANKYFYLPTLGCYIYGELEEIGGGGIYWSSSSFSVYGDGAYCLYFDRNHALLNDGRGCDFGIRAEALQ